MPTHSETKILPYRARQMYDLVADVESYPQFLPWTAGARIRKRLPHPMGEVLEADLIISFKIYREKFGSRVTLLPGQLRIETEYLDGPFRRMKSHWQFADRPHGCDVSFFVDFEFRNIILQKVIGLFFNEAMQQIVRAFEKRAFTLYSGQNNGT